MNYRNTEDICSNISTWQLVIGLNTICWKGIGPKDTTQDDNAKICNKFSLSYSGVGTTKVMPRPKMPQMQGKDLYDLYQLLIR